MPSIAVTVIFLDFWQAELVFAPVNRIANLAILRGRMGPAFASMVKDYPWRLL